MSSVVHIKCEIKLLVSCILYRLGLTNDDEKEVGHNKLGTDNKPFTTLGYTNGPGAFASVNETVRPNLTVTDTGKITLCTIHFSS